MQGTRLQLRLPRLEAHGWMGFGTRKMRRGCFEFEVVVTTEWKTSF